MVHGENGKNDKDERDMHQHSIFMNVVEFFIKIYVICVFSVEACCCFT